jgi:hypothetical protein
MNCPHCGKPAEAWIEPDRTGAPRDMARCYTCKRERVMLQDGAVKWILMGPHCRKCGVAIWRHARHEKYGHVVYLWPDPTHVTARHFVYGSDGVLQPYCADCAPKLGEPAPHQAELGAEPITIGPVIGYEPTPIRYAHTYSARYARFLRPYLRDELGLDDEAAAVLVAQHDADCERIRRVEGAPTEPA